MSNIAEEQKKNHFWHYLWTIMSKACNFAFQSSSQSPTSQDKPQVLSADDSAIVDDPEFVSTSLFN